MLYHDVPYSGYFSKQIKFLTAMRCMKIKRSIIISIPKLMLNEESVTDFSK